MGVFVSDTFTDTNGTTLQSHTPNTGGAWSSIGQRLANTSNSTRDAEINSNTLRNASTSTFEFAAGYRNAAVPDSADYVISATANVVENNSAVSAATWELGARMSPTGTGSSVDRYAARIGGNATGAGTPGYMISKVVSGAVTVLASDATAIPSGTYALEFRITDAAKQLWVNGVQKLTTADNVITQVGRVGLLIGRQAGGTLDSFVADTGATGVTAEPDPILVSVTGSDVTAAPGGVTAEPDPLLVTVTVDEAAAVYLEGQYGEPDPILVTVTAENVTATVGNVTAEPDPITVTVTAEDVEGNDGSGDDYTAEPDPILVSVTFTDPPATGGVALATFEVDDYTDDSLDFEAVLTVEIVPEPVPATLSVEPVQRTSVTMSALPALTDGVPDPDAYVATVTRQDAGYWQVVIDGQDVTYFRDVPVEVVDFGSADPFGDTTATLRFPQITPFEALGTGALDWLRDFVTVEIYLVPTDYPTSPKRVLYEGEVASYDDSSTDLGVVCLGALYEVDLGLALPHYYREPKTAEKQLRWLFAPYSWRRLHLRTRSMRFAFPPGWTRTDDAGDLWTGFWRHEAESWERPVTGLAAEYLAGMIETDGTQWTILHAPGRKPILQQRDTTTVDYTVTCGAHGVTHDLRDDATQRVNVYFGEGTDRAGTTWRNMHPLSEWVEYQPVAIELEASARMPDSVGTDPEPNPDYDPSIVRVEQHIAFGSGIGLDTAQAVAARQIARNSDGAWAGSITLEADPEEASRFTIRGGDNILLKNHRGTDRLLHVASVRHTPQSSTLTVDTAGRDYLTVEKLIARRREASVSPARRLAYGTESTTTDDTRAPWDDYAAAGHIPRASREWPDGTLRRRNHKQTAYPPSSNPDLYVEVVGGKWSYERVVVGQKGTAQRIEVYAYGTAGSRKATRFFAGLFTARHSKSLLPDNPLAITWRDWLTDDYDSLMESRVAAWGQDGEAAGYWPGRESDGDSPTGAMVDEGTWQWELEPGENSLWLALWSPDDAFFQGRIVHGVQ